MRRKSVAWMFVAALLVFAACTPAPVSPPPPPPPPPPPAATRLACLSSRAIDSIRVDPTNIAGVFASCKTELQSALGSSFSALDDRGLGVAFAALVAHGMAPYGRSVKLCLKDLLAEKLLDCDNYAFLAVQLAALLPDPPQPGELRMLGFDHGAIGNHAQLFLDVGPLPLLLDPTVGLVVAVPAMSLLSGEPIRNNRIVNFYAYGDELQDFLTNVVNALRNGSYRWGDIIYEYSLADLSKEMVVCASPAAGEAAPPTTRPSLETKLLTEGESTGAASPTPGTGG